MTTCPNCHHEELIGALYCSDCGAQLVTTDPFGTRSIRKTPSDFFAVPADARVQEVQPETKEDARPLVVLRVVDDNQVIRLNGRSEYTLGRIAEGQPILPDVDLSTHDAYPLGVSRLHIAIKVAVDRIVVMDLGSSNGTRINGQKIVPHVDYPVNLGDIIALGKLKVQVISYRPSEN